jgi:hypothetical protein
MRRFPLMTQSGHCVIALAPLNVDQDAPSARDRDILAFWLGRWP